LEECCVRETELTHEDAIISVDDQMDDNSGDAQDDDNDDNDDEDMVEEDEDDHAGAGRRGQDNNIFIDTAIISRLDGNFCGEYIG
jgi:hypothetical protein